MSTRDDLANALRQRLLSSAHLGALRSGERLPSVRQLALEFGVAPRSVLAAYRTLEREGLVELRERSGIFFATRGPSAWQPGNAELPHDAAWTLDVLHQGYERGRTLPESLADLVRYAARSRLRVAGIECNDDQIAGLVAALKADFGLDAVGLNVDSLLDSVPPIIEGVDLLVTTAFHAGEVKEIAARANVSWLAISYRSDVFVEIARLLPTTQVHFIVNDARFATKLKKIYASLPGAENLHIIRIDEIGEITLRDDATVFASAPARQLLKSHWINDRIVAATRLISNDSAREILSFIVRSNVMASSERGGR